MRLCICGVTESVWHLVMVYFPVTSPNLRFILLPIFINHCLAISVRQAHVTKRVTWNHQQTISSLCFVYLLSFVGVTLWYVRASYEWLMLRISCSRLLLSFSWLSPFYSYDGMWSGFGFPAVRSEISPALTYIGICGIWQIRFEFYRWGYSPTFQACRFKLFSSTFREKTPYKW